MWDNYKNISLLRRIVALVLCAFITVAYTPGLAYALEEQTGDAEVVQDETAEAEEVAEEEQTAEEPAEEELDAEEPVEDNAAELEANAEEPAKEEVGEPIMLKSANRDGSDEGEDESFSLDECQIEFKTEYYNGEAPYYSVDARNGETLSVEDLNISVIHNGRWVDPEKYELKFAYSFYDEEKDESYMVEAEPPLGVQQPDMEADYAYTEYYVTAVPSEGSNLTGETDPGAGSFFIRDKHSLQFMGAYVSFDKGAQGSWRMRDRFWIKTGEMTAPYVAAIDEPGTQLTEGTDYIITYYNTAFDPDNNDPDDDGEYEDWWEYLPEDDENKLDKMPTEPGHYFLTIDGTGEYTGHGRVLFDIVEYTPFEISHYTDTMLWSDSTKDFWLYMPDEVSGNFRLSGTANTDWGETVFPFELSDDCYEYNDAEHLLVLDGAAVLNEVGRGAWLDLTVDIVDDEDNLVARGLTAFEVKEAYKEYDLEGDRDMLPGWDGDIQERRWAREENAGHPGGIEGDYFVQSVKVIQGAELLDPEIRIDDEGYLEKEDEHWYYRIKNWSPDFDFGDGKVVLEITYKDLSGEEQSYTVTLNVGPEIYEVWLSSDDNRYDGLPGHSFDISAPGRHVYYDENGEYHEDAENLTYKWFYAIGAEMSKETNERHEPADNEWREIPSGGLTHAFADFSVKSGDSSKALLKFKTLTGEQDHDEFYVKAALVDGDGDLIASEWREFRCHNEYTTVYPTSLGDLNIGESTDYVEFEVRKYSTDSEASGGYTTVDDAEFTWFFDEEGLEITEKYTEDGESRESVIREGETAHGNTFRLTRLRDWDVNFRVEARWTEPDDRIEQVDQEYHFNRKDYNFWIERDTDLLFTDGTAEFKLEGQLFDNEGWTDNLELVYELGTGEWTQVDEEDDNWEFNWDKKFTKGKEYDVSADGRTITLYGDKLSDYVDQDIRVFVKLKMKGSDEVIGETEGGTWVRKPWTDYHYNDFEMLPGWDNGIDGYNNIYVENSEFPGGEELWYDVDSVEVTGGAEFLDPEDLETSGGKTYLKRIFDENDNSRYWYDYRIKDMRDLDPDALGDVEFKVNYVMEPDGDVESFTFKVSVVTDIYEMDLYSVNGKDTGLPGDVIDLKASEVTHKFVDENGDHQDEILEGVNYEWSHDWGDENLFRIEVDDEDSSVAHITLIAPEDRSNYWEGFGIKASAFKGGKLLNECSFGLGVASDYTEIEPVRIDDLGVGESTEVDLRAVRYSTTQGEVDLTDEVQFRIFSEGGFIIEDSEGVVENDEVINGTHIKITRTAHPNDRFVLKVDSDEGSAEKEYWFSYADPEISNYQVVYRNSEDGWRLLGDFKEGDTLTAADEVDIENNGKILDPAYYDLKIFWSHHDEETDEQVEEDVSAGGVFTYHGNDNSSYYVRAVANAAGEKIGLSGETDYEPWIDLLSTSSLDPFGPEVYFEGRERTDGPHPQRDYYWFRKGTSAAPTVKILDKVLREGADYEVTYIDEYTDAEYKTFPTEPGTYTCMIRPADGSDYTGENGLMCVVVLLDDGTVGDLGYSEFAYDSEHLWPTWDYYYDFSFDEKYHVREEIESTPYEDWFYVVPSGTKLDPIVKHGDKVIDPKFLKATYLEQVFDPSAENGEGAWGPKPDAQWLNEFPTEEGVYFCKVEGKTPYYGSYEWFDLIRIEKHTHIMTAHPAVDATCTAGGNSAYWSCSECGKFFSDAEGKTEIAKDSWVIEALGHNMTEHAAKAATREAEGNTAYWSCDRCNKFFSDAKGTLEIAKDSWVIPKVEPSDEEKAAAQAIEEASAQANDASGKADAAVNSTDENVVSDAESSAAKAAELAAVAEARAEAAFDKAEAAFIKALDSDDEVQKEIAKNNLDVATENLATAKVVKAAANSALAKAKQAAANMAASKAAAASAAAEKAADPTAAEELRKEAEAQAAIAAEKAASAETAASVSGKAAAELGDLAEKVQDPAVKEAVKKEQAAAEKSAGAASESAQAAETSSEEARASEAEAAETVVEKKRQGVLDKSIPKMTIKTKTSKKTSITIKWKWTTSGKKKLKKSKATKYEIWVCPNTKFAKADTIVKTCSKSKTSYTVKSLKKYKKYYFKIRAIKYVGGVKHVGPWSSRKYIKTKKK